MVKLRGALLASGFKSVRAKAPAVSASPLFFLLIITSQPAPISAAGVFAKPPDGESRADSADGGRHGSIAAFLAAPGSAPLPVRPLSTAAPRPLGFVVSSEQQMFEIPSFETPLRPRSESAREPTNGNYLNVCLHYCHYTFNLFRLPDKQTPLSPRCPRHRPAARAPVLSRHAPRRKTSFLDRPRPIQLFRVIPALEVLLALTFHPHA